MNMVIKYAVVCERRNSNTYIYIYIRKQKHLYLKNKILKQSVKQERAYVCVSY